MNNGKQAVVLFLIIVTFLLGAVVLYIGINLDSGTQSTDDGTTTVSPTGGGTTTSTDDSTNTTDDDEDGDNDIQVDIDVAEGSQSCGASCNSDADCNNPFAPGNPDAVACVNNICVNTYCPEITTSRANCDCPTFTQSCGQPCGSGFPLCGDGISGCGYINTTGQCSSDGSRASFGGAGWNQYCIPSNPLDGYYTQSCSSGELANILIDPVGDVATSVEQILDACEADVEVVETPTPVCGNGVVESGEQCDGGSNCSASCQKVLPQTAISDDIQKSAFLVGGFALLGLGSLLTIRSSKRHR